MYKKYLFFISKCLTISFDEKNKESVLLFLKKEKIDWDEIVKISTGHYVFIALYCNLKKVNYLEYLPKDLVTYMGNIYKINLERNKKIIAQVKDLNNLLLAKNIKPIFLKGTSNIMQGLYDDISERMIGDIDFIVSKNEYSKTIELLLENGYDYVSKQKYTFPQFKHHPRLKKKNNIAAVEIHKELLKEEYASEFNYNLIYKSIKKVNDIFVLKYEDQLALSIISKQIEDEGFYYNDISLRNAYDVLILSKKIDAKKAISKFKKLKNPLNCFLAVCFITFGRLESLEFHRTKEAYKYLSNYDSLINNNWKSKIILRIKKLQLFLKVRIYIIYKSVIHKEYRNWLIERLKNKTIMKKL